MAMSKHEMFAPMLAACGSFGPAWQKFAAEARENEPDDPLYFVALGDLATHLLELDTRGQTAEFAAVFAVVETWLLEGDDYVRNAAVIGLFESLQNVAGWRKQGLVTIESYLQPISKKWWDNLSRYWDGDISALTGL